MIGSIGVYMVMYDMSEAAEAAGIGVEVIRDGDFKGAGEPGTKITDEQRAQWQGVVDAYGAQFRKTVSDTRFADKPLTKGSAPANGQVYIGSAARSAGLVDGVTSLDNVLTSMRRRTRPTT